MVPANMKFLYPSEISIPLLAATIKYSRTEMVLKMLAKTRKQAICLRNLKYKHAPRPKLR